MTTLKKENKRFKSAFDKLSEKDKNKIAEIENERTPEEEKALECEADAITANLTKKGTFKKLDAAIAARAAQLQNEGK